MAGNARCLHSRWTLTEAVLDGLDIEYWLLDGFARIAGARDVNGETLK